GVSDDCQQRRAVHAIGLVCGHAARALLTLFGFVVSTVNDIPLRQQSDKTLAQGDLRVVQRACTTPRRSVVILDHQAGRRQDLPRCCANSHRMNSSDAYVASHELWLRPRYSVYRTSADTAFKAPAGSRDPVTGTTSSISP